MAKWREMDLAEYKSVVGPLMSGVTDQLARLGSNLRDALQAPMANQPSNPLLLDLRDSMALLQLRSKQVQAIWRIFIKLLLVDVGFFQCHMYWSIIEQLVVLYPDSFLIIQDYWSKNGNIVCRSLTIFVDS